MFPVDTEEPIDPLEQLGVGVDEMSMNLTSKPTVPMPPGPKEFEKTDLHRLLEDIVEEYIKHEEFVRDRILQEVRRNNLYDEGIQNIFINSLSGTVGNWSTFNEYMNSIGDIDNVDDLDVDIKYINIYKAYKDSLTAVLSAKVPATRFLPDDAENIDDIYTAEAFDKLATLVRRHNKSKMLLIQMLSIFINEGICCVHNYADRDGKYGYAQKDVTGLISTGTSTNTCPNCGTTLTSEEIPAEYIDEASGQIPPENSMEFGTQSNYCPTCMTEVNPLIDTQYNTVQGVIGQEDVEKVREIQEAYGLTNVRFPAYAMTQGQIPYIVLEYECSVAQAEDNWKHLKGKIVHTNHEGPNDNKWARLNSFYTGETPKYTCTVQEVWLRSWAFNILNSEEFRNVEFSQLTGDNAATMQYQGINPETGKEWQLSEVIQELYPSGIRIVLVNGDYAEHNEENLDDHWTISYNPIYRYLIGKSIGSTIIPIQDLANDNIAITEQTIEHSIMETFVSSKTLDLDKYKESEIRPGDIIPVAGEPGEALGNQFYQTKGATLSQEVGLFANRIEKLGEFVSGAMPGVYGGDLAGSNTAAQYSMSRAQSLQRLTIPWDIICNLWSDMEFKSLKDYAKNLDYDERYPVKSGGSYKNIYIEQVKLKGNVACVEPESEGYFPMTYAQQRDLLKELLTLNNPDISMVIMHPENRNLVGALLGPTDLYVPGEEDRKKQLAEIAELIKGVPVLPPLPQNIGGIVGENMVPSTMDSSGTMIPPNPMQGMNNGIGNPNMPPGIQPSIMPEPLIDDDMIHLEVIKRWANSAEGQSYKRDSPQQYANVLAHGQLHYQNMMLKQAQQAQANPEGKPEDKDKVEPPKK